MSAENEEWINDIEVQAEQFAMTPAAQTPEGGALLDGLAKLVEEIGRLEQELAEALSAP